MDDFTNMLLLRHQQNVTQAATTVEDTVVNGLERPQILKDDQSLNMLQITPSERVIHRQNAQESFGSLENIIQFQDISNIEARQTTSDLKPTQPISSFIVDDDERFKFVDQPKITIGDLETKENNNTVPPVSKRNMQS